MELRVTKADGEQELFEIEKLRSSLARTGVTEHIQDRVIEHVRKELYDGIETKKIYAHAFALLKKWEAPHVAARYSLKRAVFDLGPSGFPFEQFVAALLRTEGWQTHTDVQLYGKCAPHEVDILAERDGVRAGIELKFHNNLGVKTDLKDALYVYARFEDLKNAPNPKDRVTEGWLVTNTRLTKNATRYGRCSGLTMIGWDYPHEHGIEDMIERSGVHPLTCLVSLSSKEKQALLAQKIVLCSALTQRPEILESAGVRPGSVDAVLAEARTLCEPTYVRQPVLQQAV